MSSSSGLRGRAQSGHVTGSLYRIVPDSSKYPSPFSSHFGLNRNTVWPGIFVVRQNFVLPSFYCTPPELIACQGRRCSLRQQKDMHTATSLPTPPTEVCDACPMRPSSSMCVCVCVCVLQGMARDPTIPVEDAWGVLGERGKGTCLQSGPKQAGVVSLACGGCAAYPSTRLERENTVLRTTHDEWAAAGTDREASGGRAGPAAKREMHRQCQSEGRTRGRITLCREAVVA